MAAYSPQCPRAGNRPETASPAACLIQKTGGDRNPWASSSNADALLRCVLEGLPPSCVPVFLMHSSGLGALVLLELIGAQACVHALLCWMDF